MEIVIMKKGKQENTNGMEYGCVETVGGLAIFQIKNNAKEFFMLPQTQNQIFMFKMIHCNGNGNMMAVIMI